MSNVEKDLEQLESYLDGALDAGELSVLDMRLKTDADLSNTLTELKAQRAVRAAVWQSNEPDAAAADRLMWRVRGAMLQQKQQDNVARTKRGWSQWRFASVGSAAAACLMLGFMFGRLGHATHLSNSNVPQFPSAGIAVNDPSAGAADPVRTISETVPHEVIVQGDAVPIYNEYGKLVTVQHFGSHDEAVQFARDLHGTHVEPSIPAVPGPSRLATEEH
jgi:anti-sigma factor RsiW